MPRPLNAEEKKLLELAKAQQLEIQDPAVANAWNVIVEAVEKSWLGMSGAFSLQNTITELAGGGRVAVEEYSIEVSPDDAEEVIVSLMADQFYAPRAALLQELRRLLARQRGEETAAAPAIAEAEPLAPIAPLAPIVPLKLVPPPNDDDDHSDASDGDAPAREESGDDDASSTIAAQLGKMIESFADRVKKPAAAAGDSAARPAGVPRLGLLDSIRAEFDKARAEQAAKNPQAAPSPAAEEAKAALDKVIDKVRGIDRDQLALAIHNVADWVKSPEGGPAAFEGLLNKLQTSLTAAFDKSAKPAGESPASSPFKGVREAMEKRIADAKEQVERERARREQAARDKNAPPDDN